MTTQESVYQFIGKPKTYSGIEGQGISAKTWLKSLQRIKDCLEFDDNKMLWIAASNLSGVASMWMDSNEDEIATWVDFKRLFTSQFVAGDNRDHLWHELKNLRQENRSVDELGFKLCELFTLLGIKDDQSKRRYLESALHPELAMMLETKDDIGDFKASLNYAKKMERLKRKYGESIFFGGPSSVSSTQSVSTVGRLAQDFRSMNVNMVKPGFPTQNRTSPSGVTPTQQANPRAGGGGRPCFICEEMGHFATDCPWKAKIKELKGTNGTQNMDSGKGLDRQ